MESKNVWQQILGGNIWGANSFEMKKKIFFFFGGGGGGGGGGKWGTISFKANFEKIFGTKFWRRDSCEEEISLAKIFWRIFVSKISL